MDKRLKKLYQTPEFFKKSSATILKKHSVEYKSNMPCIVLKSKNRQNSTNARDYLLFKIKPNEVPVYVNFITIGNHSSIILNCASIGATERIKEALNHKMEAEYNINETKLKK